MVENQHTISMTPPHPGRFLRDEVLEPLGLTVKQAAQVLDVRRATLSDLVQGKASLSPDMALRLEMAFGLEMEQMLRMQAWCDACRQRQRADQPNIKRYEPA